MPDFSDFISHISQNIYAVYQTVLRRIGLDKAKPVMVDLSKQEMSRIGPGTENVKGIYFSDFVEGKNSNQIRYAVDFRSTSDTLVTDHNIPLSKISRFYGVEDGKVKIGGLDNFRDSSVVVPVRNKNYGAISHIDIQKTSFWDRISFNRISAIRKRDKEIRSHADRLLKEADALGIETKGNIRSRSKVIDLKRDVERLVCEKMVEICDWKDEHDKKSLDLLRKIMKEADKRHCRLSEVEEYGQYVNMGKERASTCERYDSYINSLDSLCKGLVDLEVQMKNKPSLVNIEAVKSELRMFDINGNKLADETMLRNSDVKLLLADSTGRAVFINDLMGLSDLSLSKLNRDLKDNPLYPVLVDNGRYSHYELNAASYKRYIRQDLHRPDESLFVIGSVKNTKNRRESRVEQKGEDLNLRRKNSVVMYKRLCDNVSNAHNKGLRIK